MSRLNRFCLANSAILLAFFVASGTVFAQSDAETPPDAPVVQSTGDPSQPAETDSADQNLATADDAPTAEEQIDQAEVWMATVNEWFGKYLVTPLYQVLFYDFETSKWLGVSVPFVVAWLFAGAIFLTVRMGFINIRGFFHAIQLTRGVYDTPGEPGEVSHFQALSAALSATVGLGNIAGVAIAIATGGPGATFWIIMVGLLGMSAKFAECTLGQMYRVSDEDGTVIGGPMRYLKYGLRDVGLGPLGSFLSVLFMILCIGASFGGGNAFQVGQSLEAIRGDVPVLQTAPWAYGIIMAIAVGVVIIGGIKSIGAVASKIVPLMCLAYVSVALYILVTHAAEIPGAINTIITQAFKPDAAYGGFIGVLVIGIRRAVFSNEAGVGSAAIAHSAAKTDEPVSEGIVALLEPFIDTVVVCTITALMVVITGAYLPPKSDISNVKFTDKSGGEIAADQTEFDSLPQLMAENVHTNLTITAPDTDLGRQRAKSISSALESQGVQPNRIVVVNAEDDQADSNTIPVNLDIAKSDGARITLQAFISGGEDWFRYVLFIAVVLFAYSTCISWSYYGERCWVQLFGERTSMIYKALFLLFTVLGSIVTRGNILDFSDLMLLGMSIPNLLGVFLLSGLVKRQLDIYWNKYKNDDLERADQYK